MKPKMPPIKLVKDEIDAGDVFLFGGKTHYYGERAEIVDASSLETNGRVNSKFYFWKNEKWHFLD